MKVLYTLEFRKNYSKLPASIQKLYKKQETIFHKDPRDPRLHTKKLKGEPVTFSFRITRSYRVLFFFVSKEEALFVSIGHRKDSYR
jgi:mRNA-degrading endonuclease RelE of RelBE toxin-antitoxin system